MATKKKCRATCRMCGSENFKTVIDFGKNPLVNSLINKDALDKVEPVYPLIVDQCQNCFLVQIVNPIDAHQIYQNQDYLYFSSDMPQLSEYFMDYANDVHNRFLANHKNFVVEIGSNDGILLRHFQAMGQQVLGVDPATNVVVKALANNVPTLSAFFNERVAKNISKYWGQAKVICGNNCIAHLNNLNDLMAGVLELLVDNGVFIVECNYWGGMVKNKNYSLIYHDHFSYFSAEVWQKYLSNFEMELFDAFVTPAQGGSLRFFAARKGKYEVSNRLKELLVEEVKIGLNTYETAQKYSREVKQEARSLYKVIHSLVKKGKKIAGYGAAAKGFSVLKLAKIDQRHISYFVDDSPAKQGKYTPVTHIPVISRAEAEKQLPNYFFITAPNYADIIMEKEKEFKQKGGKFILTTGQII